MIDPQLLMLSVGIGLVVALALAEGCGLSTGGFVVPGYLALFLPHPESLLGTLLVASLAYLAVNAASVYLLIFGRRRTVLTLLIGFLLGSLLDHVAPGYPLPTSALGDAPGVVGLTTVGHVIPGLIALWFDRDGPGPALGGILLGACLTRLTLIAVAGDLAPGTGWERAGWGA
ncbi:MAG: poly-gamma-glutamate biosynthesis protein PgsC [Planctomycetota bacterium]